MPNQNIITASSPILGEFQIIATDEQVKLLIHQGATTMNKIANIDDWFMPNNIGTTNVEGGFVGGKVDWSRYFPGISSEEIDQLIADALKKEKEMKIATIGLFAVLGVGLATALGSGSPLAGGMAILGVIGSYFSDNSTPA